MRVKPAIRIAVALVAVALIAAWLLRSDAPVAAADTAPVGREGGDRSADWAATPPVPDAAAITNVPRPPRSTPLPTLWRDLAPAARAGHAPSACRLAVEALRCEFHAFQTSLQQTLPSSGVPEGELEALQAFVSDPTGMFSDIARVSDASTIERVARINGDLERHCGPPEPNRRGEALAFLRQAALAGVPDAQALYASWGGYTLGMLPGTMAEPVFERWMDEAPTVMTRMLDAGHPEAPRLLSEAYGRDQFFGWLFPYDPVRSVAYAQLDRRIHQNKSLASRFLNTRRASLSASQRAEADALTERLYAAHYPGQSASARRDSRMMLSVIHAGTGAAAPGSEAECAPGLTETPSP